MAVHPYDLIADPRKTTITAPGGIALGYGPGPGLSEAIFWNRIGSLFSCKRPALAHLSVFDARDTHQPLPLRTAKTDWRPNHAMATYRAGGLSISEDRFATISSLHCRLKLKSTAKIPRSYVLFFQGSVEQWGFFDYPRVDKQGNKLAAPNVDCAIDPKRREVQLTQPHPHHGLPRVVNSINRVWLELPSVRNAKLASYGFGLNEADLRALWHDHGALSCIRMRLGQVGGRFIDGQPAQFSHPHPRYYFAVTIDLEPGEEREVVIRSDLYTDDECGDLRTKAEQARCYSKPDVELARSEKAWRRYLDSEVPQLDCDDRALVRYWYYVWYVLRANRTAPGKHIKHPFTAPSKYMYWGPWIWDCYFHVLGEMWLKDTQIAQDSIRAVLDMQFPNGFIPVCSGSNYRMCFHEDVPGYKNPQGSGFASYVEPELAGYKELKHPFEAEVTTSTDKFIHNEKTQTPLITVAAYELYRQLGEVGLASELYPALKKYDDWLVSRRSDESLRFILWHGDESGWDDATRHYPVPAKPFDVQVHSLLHRHGLYELAQMNEASKPEIWQRYLSTLDSLTTYWDREGKWFYDVSTTSGIKPEDKQCKQFAPSGLFAMNAVIGDEVVEACVNALEHKKAFNSPYPIPTLARCDPDYAPHGWGWNGPVWLQVNYSVITGLISNGKLDEAYALWEKTKQLIIRDGKPHSYELYDPETGTGMGCPDYSWQAMVNHLIIRFFTGVNGLLLQPALPPGLNHIKLTNLSGRISSVAIKRKKGRVTISVRYASRQVVRLKTGWIGTTANVIANGRPMVNVQQDLWLPEPGATPQKDWEIIITCR